MNAVRRPQKILVGIDGSDTSRNALRWASHLAEAVDGSVSAAMAWNYPTALLLPVVGGPVPPADYMAENSRAELSSIVSSVPEAAQAEQWIVMGSPRGVLVDASEDHDTLVVGRTGNRRLKRLWLGSTASYVVRHAECPVVIVNQAHQPESAITVAVDGSHSSIEALVWAMSLGDDHEILAVLSHDEWELDDLPLEDRFRQDLDKKADETLEHAVQTAVERAGIDDGRIKRQVRQGDPRTTIVDQANPDELLVLGAQGHSGIARWMLGSLADYAVHHAPGSVAIWR